MLKDTTLEYVKERRGKDKVQGPFREFSFKAGKKDYKTRVRVFGEQSSRSPVWVHCTCPNFRYQWDWVLTQKESSTLFKTKDKQPNVRNPKKNKSVCKHVASALDWLKKDRGI